MGVLYGFVLSMMWCAAAIASTIDFASLPDGSPTGDNQLITNQYEAEFGVTFELLGAGAGLGPRIAKVGPPQTAFQGPSVGSEECGVAVTRSDMPATGQGVGCSFLTDDGQLTNDSFTLRVRYTSPVRQASGVLIDVDGVEEWSIRALRADETLIHEIVVLPSLPGDDGLASQWSFDLDEDIWMIDLEQSGSALGVGLAFDNFSPSAPVSSVGDGVTPPAMEPRIVQVSPNPVSARTAIRFIVPSSRHVALAVHDVGGRLVETLLDGWVDGGEHEVSWSIAKRTGRPTSGVYFLRLNAGTYSESRRMVVTK